MRFTSTAPRLGGILTAISEETKASPDAALYYSLPDLCQAVQCVSPSHIEVHAALQRAGYTYSQFHHDPTAVKTNAPASFMFDLMRAWCVLHPPEGSKHKAQSAAAAAILSRSMTHEVSFEVPEALKLEHNRRKKDALARFPNNPEDNWGPKKRAAGSDKSNSNSKKKKNGGE
jgi:tRNA (guanine26-N2/guanine27-N2)-dimethyltransferase